MFYKYASIDQNLFSLFINNELWFSNPLDFNDPYDCNLNYDFSDISYDIIYNYLKGLKDSANWGEAKLVEKALLLSDVRESEELGKIFRRDTVGKVGITCFSEHDDILLMWSHYANSHKGVCLTFDFSQDEQLFRLFFKVNYPDDYPSMNPYQSHAQHIKFLMATKSQEWSYEKEIRVMRDSDFHSKFRGAIPYNPKALTEIKFGYKATEESIKTIQNLVKDKYPHVKLYRSQIRKQNFGVEFIPVL
jgi:hypothetical protein